MAIPGEVQGIKRLADVIPGDIFVGTSLILRDEGRFLYGIRPAKIQGEVTVLELTGIGGGLEKGDRSLRDGVRREALEEVGADVTVIPCDETLIVRGPRTVERVVIVGPERPAAVVFRNYRTPPHRPWDDENQGQACLVVFLGELVGEPRPSREHPNLLWLTAEQVLVAGQGDVRLPDLIRSGAELLEGPFGPPEEGVLRLTDSQEALALALGDDLPRFYDALGRRPWPDLGEGEGL